MTYQLIETKTLGTAAASIEFTNIPQDGTDLLVLVSLRNTTGASAWGQYQLRVNSSTTGYSERTLLGTGSAASSSSNTGLTGLFNQWLPLGGATSATFANASFYFPNYTASTNKSISIDSVTENNATSAVASITASLWSNTAAITTITFTDIAGGVGFDAGSTASLYKITRGSSNGVVVS